MALPILKVRNPWPPNEAWLTVRVSDLKYGFVLLDGSMVGFRVSRSNPNAGLFPFGAMVTIERDDGLWPWVGYIDEDDNTLQGTETTVIARDVHDAILSSAREPRDWQPLRAASGEVVERVFTDAKGRAQPPIPLEVDASFGPVVDYEARALSLDAFLRNMTDTGWEWDIRHELGFYGVRSVLRWRERVGGDYRTALVFEEGRHFEDARLRRRAKGHLSEAVAVMGGGTFRDRNQAVWPDTVEGQTKPLTQSPVLMGSGVRVNTQIANRDAALSAAQRLYEQSDIVAEQLSFELVESAFNPDQLALIEVGGTYRVRFGTLALGIGLERDVRIMGLGLGQEGVIDVEARVLQERLGTRAA